MRRDQWTAQKCRFGLTTFVLLLTQAVPRIHPMPHHQLKHLMLRRKVELIPRFRSVVVLQTISLLFTSHWWASISDRICCMKIWNSTLKSFTQLKLITSADKYFLFLWNNVHEVLGTNYCIHKGWLMAPSAKFAPSWLKPLVTPLLLCDG